MALTAIQKEAFLRRINEIPIESLKNKIDNNELTLDECIEHGLDSSKIEQLSLLEINQRVQTMQFYKPHIQVFLGNRRQSHQMANSGGLNPRTERVKRVLRAIPKVCVPRHTGHIEIFHAKGSWGHQ